MGKHFREKVKDIRFGVSSCALLEMGGRTYVPGKSGKVRIIDSASREVLADVACGYSPVVGLTRVADGVRVSLAEGRSFTMKAWSAQ